MRVILIVIAYPMQYTVLYALLSDIMHKNLRKGGYVLGGSLLLHKKSGHTLGYTYSWV